MRKLLLPFDFILQFLRALSCRSDLLFFSIKFLLQLLLLKTQLLQGHRCVLALLLCGCGLFVRGLQLELELVGCLLRFGLLLGGRCLELLDLAFLSNDGTLVLQFCLLKQLLLAFQLILVVLHQTQTFCLEPLFFLLQRRQLPLLF